MKQVIKELIDIRKELNLNFSDDALLDSATRIYATRYIEEHKRPNIEKKIEKAKEERKTAYATTEQKNLMKKLKIGFSDFTTKTEASKLIDEKLKEKKK